MPWCVYQLKKQKHPEKRKKTQPTDKQKSSK